MSRSFKEQEVHQLRRPYTPSTNRNNVRGGIDMTYVEPGIDFSHTLEHPTILVVENDPVLRDLTKNILQTAGYSSKVARDGQEALTIIHKHPALHIVLSDFQMPNMDGLQLLQMLKKNSQTRNIPFVLVTGNSSFTLRTQTFRNGALAILYKPYSPQELLHILHRAISLQTTRAVFSGNPVLTDIVSG